MANKLITQIPAHPTQPNIASGDKVLAHRAGVDVSATLPNLATLDSNNKIPVANLPHTHRWVINIPNPDDAGIGEYRHDINSSKFVVPYDCSFSHFYFQYQTSGQPYNSSTYINVAMWTAEAGSINISDSNCRQQWQKSPRPNILPTATNRLPYYDLSASQMDAVTHNDGSTTNRVAPSAFQPNAGERLQISIFPQLPNQIYYHATLVFEERN